MPISAILFGGRRATAVPLVTEAFDWQHGVFLASNVASEGTAAAENKVGELRRDPFAMLPFCGYNMGDYFGHWLTIGAQGRRRPSCRGSTTSTGSARTSDGKFVWPGFGENSRVLKWIVERLDGKAEARRDRRSACCPTARAWTPTGLDLTDEQLGPAAHRRHRGLARGGRADPRALRAASATTCRRSCGTSWTSSTSGSPSPQPGQRSCHTMVTTTVTGCWPGCTGTAAAEAVLA